MIFVVYLGIMPLPVTFTIVSDVVCPVVIEMIFFIGALSVAEIDCWILALG